MGDSKPIATQMPQINSVNLKSRGGDMTVQREIVLIKEVNTGRRSIREGWEYDTSQNAIYMSFMYDILNDKSMNIIKLKEA